MSLRSKIPLVGGKDELSLDEIDDEKLDRAAAILDEMGEEVSSENLRRQANYLVELENSDEDKFKLGFIQDREEKSITDQSLIAPKEIEEHTELFEKGYMKRGDDFVRILTVSDFPSEIAPGVLSHLYVANANIRVSQHIQPKDIQSILNHLERRLNRVYGKLINKGQKQKADKELEEERESLSDLIADIVSGDAKLFDHSIYIEIVADTKDELNVITRNVINSLGGKQINTETTERLHIGAQHSVAPLGEDSLKGARHLMQENALSTMFPFIEPELVNPDGIFYGWGQQNDPIFFEPFDLSSFIEIIVGKQGSGKTFAKMYELLVRYMKDETYNTYVIDPKANFSELARTIGGEVIEVDGDTVFNPLEIRPNAIEEVGNPYQDKGRTVVNLYNTHFDGLTEEEKGVVWRIYHLANYRYGITEDPETHHRTNSTLEDHLVILHNLSKGKDPTEFMTLHPDAEEVQDEMWERISRVEDRIGPESADIARKLFNGMESFQEGGSNANLVGRTNVDLDSPFLVFDMEAYADTNETPLMMYAILDFIYQRCSRSKMRDEMVADEVHYLLDDEHARSLLNLFARHHRHSNTRLSLISQTADEFLSDTKDDDEGRFEIYETADVKRLFYHKKVTDEVTDFHNLSEQERNFITTASRGQKSDESQYLMEITGIGKLPVTLKTDNFMKYVIDEDEDPWRPLIRNDLITARDVEWLAQNGDISEYIADIPNETLANANINVDSSEAPAD